MGKKEEIKNVLPSETVTVEEIDRKKRKKIPYTTRGDNIRNANDVFHLYNSSLREEKKKIKTTSCEYINACYTRALS